uniref:Beta-1,4-N-acetylgalactosaminyltransferase n=1 Tax=Steinernema glaseri TaxID=37863 RepID=A0A1I7YKL1_9BILA
MRTTSPASQRTKKIILLLCLLFGGIILWNSHQPWPFINSSGAGESADPCPTIEPNKAAEESHSPDSESQIQSLCPVTSPYLVGPLNVSKDALSLEEIEKLYPNVEDGGFGRPQNCTARYRVAIVVPFRDREEHLRLFLHSMHSILAKQQLQYIILLVEQAANETFNRGKLMNVGFVEALKISDWPCFLLHDVDLLPEDDRNSYTCADQPKHMAVAMNKFNYDLPYRQYFGGASALTREQFERVNGFSNDYWGWGGEDDDMFARVVTAGYSVVRDPKSIARYRMIKHTRDHGNPDNRCRFKLLEHTKQRWETEGLSDLNYTRIGVTQHRLYTKVTVTLHEQQSRAHLAEQEGLKGC